MKQFTLFATLVVFSSLVSANTYNVELNGSYTTRDFNSSKAKSSLLEATYYFSGIDDSKGPLAEAAFLNRASNISAKYGFSSEDSFDTFTTYGLGGQYVTETTGIILNFDYLNNGVLYESGSERIVDSGSFGFGAYLTDESTLLLKISTNQNENQLTGNEIDSSTLSLNYKTLLEMKNESSLAIRVRLGRTDYEEETFKDYGSFLLGADYYFGRQLSIGLNLDHFRTQSDDKAERFRFESTYFFNNKISVYGSYGVTTIDNADNLNTVSVGFQARF